jgi:hypothetical protein
MQSWKLWLAAAAAGVIANVTGYLITGRWFHAYQTRTPGTWRSGESWHQYAASTMIRLFACLAIAFACAALPATVVGSGSPLVRGACLGAVLWAIVILPVVLELALFVNWHRGFVVGLLLDWFVVAALAGAAAGIASGS